MPRIEAQFQIQVEVPSKQGRKAHLSTIRLIGKVTDVNAPVHKKPRKHIAPPYNSGSGVTQATGIVTKPFVRGKAPVILHLKSAARWREAMIANLREQFKDDPLVDTAYVYLRLLFEHPETGRLCEFNCEDYDPEAVDQWQAHDNEVGYHFDFDLERLTIVYA